MYYDFSTNLSRIEQSVKSLDEVAYQSLVDDCVHSLNQGGRVIVSGLGKNTPICEKFVGSMVSLGLQSSFLHSNTAVHGDLGMVKEGDVVVVISKSGTTPESVLLMDILKRRKGIILWVFTFEGEKGIALQTEKRIVLNLAHEGEMWNILPFNSTTVTLIVLQGLIVDIAYRMGIQKEEFMLNHPGGGIGLSFICK